MSEEVCSIDPDCHFIVYRGGKGDMCKGCYPEKNCFGDKEVFDLKKCGSCDYMRNCHYKILGKDVGIINK